MAAPLSHPVGLRHKILFLQNWIISIRFVLGPNLIESTNPAREESWRCSSSSSRRTPLAPNFISSAAEPLSKTPRRSPNFPKAMAPSPPTPAASKTITDFFARPAKRLRAATASAASSPVSSLSPEQRRRADTNLALARARRNLRLAESKVKGTPRAQHPP
jgi:hypothetical protein